MKPTFTAEDVRAFRAKTGRSIQECKRILEEEHYRSILSTVQTHINNGRLQDAIFAQQQVILYLLTRSN